MRVLDDLERIAASMRARPGVGCILVDAAIPADLCSTLPRNAAIVGLLYGCGVEGREVMGILDRMREGDWALVVPPQAYAKMLTTAKEVREDAFSVSRYSGLEVFHVRSLPSAPWRQMGRAET
jgi:hypothetical protein